MSSPPPVLGRRIWLGTTRHLALREVEVVRDSLLAAVEAVSEREWMLQY